MCDIVVSEDLFLIVYCPDKYMTQEMYDEAVDDSLAALKSICNWFATSKIIKNLFNALYVDENILYFNENYANLIVLYLIAFNCNEMGILNMVRNTINLVNNFDEDDHDTIILIKLLAWYIKFKKCKALKKRYMKS